MKRIVLSGIVALCVMANADAQTNAAKKKQSTKKAVVKKNPKKAAPAKDTSTVVLISSSTNAAKASAATRLRIADPTVNTLNSRAAGAPLPSGVSPILGMPKSTYGIVNGRILLRNTTAATPGTAYGSGAVGTGTSIMGTGTGESAIGVNGKSPEAGPWLWGSRRPVYAAPTGDSTRRQ